METTETNIVHINLVRCTSLIPALSEIRSLARRLSEISGADSNICISAHPLSVTIFVDYMTGKTTELVSVRDNKETKHHAEGG